ncbi:MAG: hypothetical protein M0R33_14010 [Methylomonas sp.]|jgi:hypothetical protein|uniref:hypothetical protein n=1 Tax=Methylomonas sp. TaxID=418 RepID=UPI0025D934A6|nr:hypothetical protein [Methylomonas sp.]MCK9607551.1 hypothetical protein [Methylomonas sp.]
MDSAIREAIRTRMQFDIRGEWRAKIAAFAELRQAFHAKHELFRLLFVEVWLTETKMNVECCLANLAEEMVNVDNISIFSEHLDVFMWIFFFLLKHDEDVAARFLDTNRDMLWDFIARVRGDEVWTNIFRDFLVEWGLKH